MHIWLGVPEANIYCDGKLPTHNAVSMQAQATRSEFRYFVFYSGLEKKKHSKKQLITRFK